MIGLVDCNNFFVSCERIFAPELEGRPVAVLSNSDGVVVARSPELKALKIPMGEPYFRLKPLAESLGIVFRSSNYELYADISRRVMMILREESPVVEQYSIDEAFLRLNLSLEEDYEHFAVGLRSKILRWVGMPVSVGIAPTRTLAKIANHLGKKEGRGWFFWPKEKDAVQKLLRETPLGEIWGIGGRTATKLWRLGLRNAAQLCAWDYQETARKFGVCLGRTVAELQGHEAIPWEGYGDATDSTTCSRVFGQPVTEIATLREAIATYAEKAAARLREMQRKAQGCTVFLVYYPEYDPHPMEGGYAVRSVLFPHPTWNNGEINQKILPLLPELFSAGRRYKKGGVTFWGLHPENQLPEDLYAEEEASRGIAEDALTVMDELNKRFGRGTLRPLAGGLDDSAWRMRRDFLTPHYTTSWHDLPLAW